jgi:wyosine [tRNA(Phe)-imidazoG37] synthetase (radical SAM superfamily)
MSYVFGPVPSRRLGRSLGIDTVPFKTCSYDCVYCQLGRTTTLTTTRRNFVPVQEVVREVRAGLDTAPDILTLSGSGEPTLYTDLGETIDRLHALCEIPVAVLTNGSLLGREDVRREVAKADLAIPSLDAGSEETFQAVNRPSADLTFEETVEGLHAFAASYTGRIWLEVFLLDGLNDQPEELESIARLASKAHPEKIQINTVARPTAEGFARPISRERMQAIATMFTPTAEVIADYQHVHDKACFASTRESVRALLLRRPCTLEDIAEGLGIHRNEATKYVQDLVDNGSVGKREIDDKVYYEASSDSA